MQSPRNYLVVMRAEAAGQPAATGGTGFVLLFEGMCYLATSKHNLVGKEPAQFTAIPFLKRTRNPRGGYKTIPLGQSYYRHPSDSDDESYDVAIFPLPDYPLEGLASINIAPIVIDRSYTVEPAIGQIVQALGYPAKYVEDQFLYDEDRLVPPATVDGMVIDLPGSELELHGTHYSIMEGYFAQTKKTKALGEGVSGGLVVLKGNQNAWLPHGIIFGEGQFEFRGSDSKTHKLSGFGFVRMQRVIETIDGRSSGPNTVR